MKKVLFTSLAMMAVTATAFAQGNTTQINQTGNFSQASADQRGRLNLAIFAQSGNGTSAAQLNKAQITQVSEPTSVGNVGIVTQQGHGHEVRLRQTGTNVALFNQQQANALAVASQNGQGNLIVSNQRSADGTAVQLTIEQTGQRNNAVISTQTDLVAGFGVSTAFVGQTGNSNSAQLNQNGDANAASIRQVNNWGNATVSQNGVRNNARVMQTGIGSTALSFNRVILEQNGNRNTIITNQTGTSNTIRMRTMGNDNTAALNQTGTGHVVRGLFGDFAIQSGNFNRLTTTQNGSNQTVSSSQMGNNNSGVITQTNF